MVIFVCEASWGRALVSQQRTVMMVLWCKPRRGRGEHTVDRSRTGTGTGTGSGTGTGTGTDSGTGAGNGPTLHLCGVCATVESIVY